MDAGGLRFGIVVSRFNEAITRRLYAGALEALTKYGAEAGQVEAVQVPGAFELPVAALHLARSGTVHAVIALGAVIRGETPHFQFVAEGATVGLTQVALQTGVPVAFGVLTCDTLAQAEARTGAGAANKGYEAACAALEMARLLRARPAR
ncbi:MAG: 6,7-dimethyl-8-ribityllumazine synthase [candidate division NC10 bacterium]|nr:6,7-dimethyl-8-ribityllumazine synthase [candidate division NC10 bacterium]